MKGRVKDAARTAVGPVADALAALGVTPNHLTIAGLVLAVFAGVAVAFGEFPLAGIILVVSSLCDMLDGAVARRTHQESVFGAHLDSSADRLAEALFFAGLLVYYHTGDPSTFYLLLAFFAVVGSFLVSYTRARAEGLGLSGAVGIMERPERLVLLILACFLGPVAMKVALWILTPLVFFTSWQRLRHVLAQTRP